MYNSTKKSIDKKMNSNEYEKHFVYKYFQNSNTDKNSPKDITEYTLKNYGWIKNVSEDLIAFKINPFEQFKDRERKAKEFKRHLEETKFDNMIISNEVMIQRHLAYNKVFYMEKLGNIIDYECDIPKELKKASIDILSYNIDKDNHIDFIIGELKVCDIDYNDPMDTNDPINKSDKRHATEAKDLLLRAIMEVAFYGMYFHYALINESGELVKYLKSLIKEEVNDDDIRNAGIKYYIIAPKNIINQRKFDCYNNFDLSKFTFFSIRQNREEFKKVGIVRDSNKYFIID